MKNKKLLLISIAVLCAVALITVICVVSVNSCNNDNHVHTYASEWTQGETKHWHASTCGHDVKKDEAEHAYENGKCTVCDYLKPTDGITYELSSDKNSYFVKDDNSVSGDIVIASIYNGKPVTSIGNSAFIYNNNITSVIIPDSVTSIETYAFDNCHNLKSVTIGKGVTSIGEQAFGTCKSLTNITIPDSVTSIATYAFGTCLELKSVTIGKGVTSIGEKAFNNCNSLIKVFYSGTTEDQWNSITISDYNEKLTDATRFYYSESDPTPTATIRYWHYNNGVPTPWYE